MDADKYREAPGRSVSGCHTLRNVTFGAAMASQASPPSSGFPRTTRRARMYVARMRCSRGSQIRSQYNGGRAEESFVTFINEKTGTQRKVGGALSELVWEIFHSFHCSHHTYCCRPAAMLSLTNWLLSSPTRSGLSQLNVSFLKPHSRNARPSSSRLRALSPRARASSLRVEPLM